MRNGKFPNFKPIPFDPLTPPVDYWNMSSRKCKLCGTQWPAYLEWQVSPCCQQGTIESSTPPHMPWKTAVESLKAALFEQLYNKWNGDMNDEQLSWLGDPQPVDALDIMEGMKEIERLIEDLEGTKK